MLLFSRDCTYVELSLVCLAMAPVLQAKQLGGIGVDTGEEAEAHTESAKTQSHSQQLPLKVRIKEG